MRRVAPTFGLLWLLAVSVGCDSLSDFGGTFEGPIIDGNFVRRCFPPRTDATLKFDPENAVAVTHMPDELNWLTTTDGAFTRTPLTPLTALPHDQLSGFDFPGPKRVRNFLLLARPESGPLAGRDAVVIVSMLEKGSLELRVMARADDSAPPCDVAAEADDASDDYIRDPHEYFGVFQLTD